MARKKQPSAVSNRDRTRDGRFALGNSLGFKPGQSGNPKGRPPALAEKLDLLDRITDDQGDHWDFAGGLVAERLRLNPDLKISIMKALRLLADELKEIPRGVS